MSPLDDELDRALANGTVLDLRAAGHPEIGSADIARLLSDDKRLSKNLSRTQLRLSNGTVRDRLALRNRQITLELSFFSMDFPLGVDLQGAELHRSLSVVGCRLHTDEPHAEPAVDLQGAVVRGDACSAEVRSPVRSGCSMRRSPGP